MGIAYIEGDPPEQSGDHTSADEIEIPNDVTRMTILPYGHMCRNCGGTQVVVILDRQTGSPVMKIFDLG